jgi:membrane protein implicated in regulation of membrane protease activity
MLSGAAAMIGQAAVVVDPLPGPHELGHVRIAGENWPALARDGSRVEAGATVRIVEIRRATLIVDPVPDLVNHREE